MKLALEVLSIDQERGKVTVPSATEQVVVAPDELSLDTRTAFRQRAAVRIDAMRVGHGRLVVDMTATETMDSAGLGTLILVQRRAAARRIRVVLRGLNEDLRFLLVLTKVHGLFEVETPET
jgi:anti-anti-sigma factor